MVKRFCIHTLSPLKHSVWKWQWIANSSNLFATICAFSKEWLHHFCFKSMCSICTFKDKTELGLYNFNDFYCVLIFVVLCCISQADSCPFHPDLSKSNSYLNSFRTSLGKPMNVADSVDSLPIVPNYIRHPQFPYGSSGENSSSLNHVPDSPRQLPESVYHPTEHLHSVPQSRNFTPPSSPGEQLVHMSVLKFKLLIDWMSSLGWI